MADSPKNESPEQESPKPNRGGPPKGSQNAFRHGLVAGKLPPRLGFVEIKANIFRRKLEASVLDVKGTISLTDAACINSACKWERHGQLALYWLTKEAETMPVAERLRFSEAAAKASDARDKAIKALGLDTPAEPKKLSDYIIEMGGSK